MAKTKPLAERMFLKPGSALLLIDAPAEQAMLFEGAAAQANAAAGADVALLFTRIAQEVSTQLPALLASLRPEARLWIAYPKAGKLGTDLNRDKLWKQVEALGVAGVRIVSLDDTWAAMMFKRTS